LLLSTVVLELRGTGPGGTTWDKLNRLDDAALAGLVAALAADRRRALDLRLEQVRNRAQSVSAEWLHELERRIDEDDALVVHP
jgi:hypothetical protein